MLLQYKLSRPGGQFGPECPGQITQIAWSLCPGMTRQFNPEVGRFTSVTWSVCPGIPGQASQNALVKYRRNTFPYCRGTSDQFQRYTQVDILSMHNVDTSLITLIKNYSEATDQSERFKIKTWRQWDYLIKTLTVLSNCLDDPPKSDINLEILKLFVCRDFNSIQVYAYFLKYIEKITLSEAGFVEQKQDLLYLLKVLKQVRIEAKHLYDPEVQSLKTSVIESITAELNYLEQKEQIYVHSLRPTDIATPSKFYFRVVVTIAELMFLFRIFLEVEFIHTKFKSYLYEFVSNHIQTERSEMPSLKSQRNHFNNKPFPDRVVRSVRDWLTKMINHIDRYYKVDF